DGKIFEEMYTLLDKFPNPKIILTNANDEEIKNLGLVDLPYELYTLKHNPDKTDPEYFRTLLKDKNLKPEDCVYFEHTPEAVESAQTFGIVSYFYDDIQKDLESLQKFLEKNL
ncbi:HAD-IA family hydrolase, partial [Candidatus Dojkabacteria bacterium]|nr:HAD-IA family hydrolase [Candidatus Dojkabacteria bacterium]